MGLYATVLSRHTLLDRLRQPTLARAGDVRVQNNLCQAVHAFVAILRLSVLSTPG